MTEWRLPPPAVARMTDLWGARPAPTSEPSPLRDPPGPQLPTRCTPSMFRSDETCAALSRASSPAPEHVGGGGAEGFVNTAGDAAGRQVIRILLAPGLRGSVGLQGHGQLDLEGSSVLRYPGTRM
jgi:hypothetical protein